MIPAAFEYYRPDTIADALKILEEHGDDARVMAGGHSLVPM
ncbi:MAG: FAD binding domain-containing protein, partial [Pseudomonadota bacterium]